MDQWVHLADDEVGIYTELIFQLTKGVLTPYAKPVRAMPWSKSYPNYIGNRFKPHSMNVNSGHSRRSMLTSQHAHI